MVLSGELSEVSNTHWAWHVPGTHQRPPGQLQTQLGPPNLFCSALPHVQNREAPVCVTVSVLQAEAPSQAEGRVLRPGAPEGAQRPSQTQLPAGTAGLTHFLVEIRLSTCRGN